MSQPRITNEDGLLIKNLPLHAESILAATVIEVGDMLRYESDATAILSGVALFADDLVDAPKFAGFSKGKSKTNMASGAYGDHIPVVLRGIIEVDLASASYNFGDPLGYSMTKNKLSAAVLLTNPTLGFFYGTDEDTITRGLVWIDIPNLATAFIPAS